MAIDIDEYAQFRVPVADAQIGLNQLRPHFLLQDHGLIGQQKRCGEHLRVRHVEEIVSSGIGNDLIQFSRHRKQARGDLRQALCLRVTGVPSLCKISVTVGFFEVAGQQRDLPFKHQDRRGRVSVTEVGQQVFHRVDVAFRHGQLGQRIVGQFRQEGELCRWCLLFRGIQHQFC